MTALSIKSILIVSLIGIGLLVVGAVSGYQYAQWSTVADSDHGVIRMAELELMRIWGCYIEALGGVPSGGDFEFEGKNRVNAIYRQCVFKFTKESDADLRKKLMNTIAPKVVLGVDSELIDQVEVEWNRFASLPNGKNQESRHSFYSPPGITVELARIGDKGYIWIRNSAPL
ncbi:MAG: hypothetical protein JWN70_5882 [Planctomycetaceae bacterium]|nr:hypothetical protein [Planctomycetaceae bacterium]